MNEAPEIPFVVEGDTDVPFAACVVRAAGGMPGTPYVQRGKPTLLSRLPGYANAARNHPWLVLIDQDDDFDCPPAAREAWFPLLSAHLAARIVVQSIEAWALGDRDAAARFFGLRAGAIPRRPEEVDNPKRTLVQLASHSRRKAIQRDMVPRRGSGRIQGAGYEARLIEFGENHWRLEQARLACPSLDRAVVCLTGILAAFRSD